ncbi:hypothetical protein H109_07533 [Trichophyton interdigitale MR816]|uniref:Zn(2)-C6 fungal-type domain-containing protein n=1 Tax=Trichophyton interdigitale (strain MR816) TaxID=1215338 RepID=A0A059IYJ4_TRIIM|nr:hypothetical protein H101_01849 [Trichophyton interdigitale H6]KDB20528.1 hypothetical protein H109_07533 [Trichophyton interdigitale MR816]
MAAAYLPSMKTRKRNACDKRHNLKSKCMRASEDNECKRCARLGLDYVYSAPLPLGRPRGRRRPKSSSNTAPSDNTSSYIASYEVSLSLAPSLHNSLSESISSNNGRIYCGPPSRYYTDQGNSSLATDVVTNNPSTSVSNNRQHLTDHLQFGDIGFQNIQTQLSFSLDSDLSATIQNSSNNKSYPEVSYRRLYQIYRIHTRIQDLVTFFSSSSTQPLINTIPPNRDTTLAEILSATDELVQIISTSGSEFDFRSDISQDRLSHCQSYSLPTIAFPSHTSLSSRPLSFPIIISSYTNLLQIYEPVIEDLLNLIQRLPSSSPSQQQQWHISSTGVTLQESEILPGELRVLSDTELNVSFLVSLVSQSVERLRNAIRGYLRMLFPEQSSQNFMHATRGSDSQLTERVPQDMHHREQRILAWLHAIKNMQSELLY